MKQASLFDQIGFAEDSPAKTYRWLDDVLDLLESVADCSSSSCGSSMSSVPAGLLSKTSLVFCRAIGEGIWASSSGRWGNWGMGGPTGCLTLNGSEFPSAAVVSSLSDVLETGDVPRKYFLSPKACRGILRRAAKRGRELPTQLREALQAAAIDTTPTEKTL